ncbi:MAG: patatin-like phospholipase family protein [Longimicrobiales bacterium]
MAYHFRNLVFEGGGVKGIAYVGALEILARKKILADVERIGGTSAGAITAALVGLGYSTKQIREILWDLDFRKFLDDSWGVVRDTKRLVNEFGWYKGDFFRTWIGDRIRERTENEHTTFRDVDHWIREGRSEFRHLYFIGTNLSTGFAEIFSHEHTPRMPIADAVRISMSLPLFFTAKRSVRGDVYVDGGMLDNYPIKLFDRRKYVESHCIEDRDYYVGHNETLKERGFVDEKGISEYVYNQETLGFRLDTRAEIAAFRDQAEPPRRVIGDFFDYAGGLVGTLLNVQQSIHLHSDDWHRTIYIDTLDVGTTDFDLDEGRKKALVESGRDGTKKYFEWYDGAPDEETVWNRPVPKGE